MNPIDLQRSGVKWFYQLIPSSDQKSLYDFYSDREISQGLLVCGFSASDRRLFALFPNYIAYAKFHHCLPPEKRCFFEIIPGNKYQKPHFDIDYKTQEDKGRGEELFTTFLEHLITSFEKIYSKKLSLPDDVLIFTSHGKDKKSFHVVLDNYCHTNNKEAKAFYDRVMEDLPEEYQSPVVDSSVYSSRQQFRIIGSQKKGSGRPKIQRKVWTYKGESIEYQPKEEAQNERHEYILSLEASLVSSCHSCQVLPCLLSEVEESSKGSGSNYSEAGDISPETASVALDLLKGYSNSEGKRKIFPYELRGVVDNFVLLKRLHPSRCKVCKRTHEHENPYLFVITDEDTLRRRVYFDCRRANGRKLYIGLLPEEINGKPLMDSPLYQEGQRIIEKVAEVSGMPMSEIKREFRKRGTLYSRASS